MFTEHEIVKFWSKVDRETGPMHPYKPELGRCWPWTRASDTNGYGNVRIGLRFYKAHRASWSISRGELSSPRVFVCHSCDYPPCCNPDHLFLGDNKINQADCISKNRHWNPLGDKNWCTKLTYSQVSDAKFMIRHGMSHTEVGKFFGVKTRIINNLWRGVTWPHHCD